MIKKIFLLAALSFVAVSYASAQYYFDFGYSEDSVVNVSATATDYVIDFNLNVSDLVETFHLINNDEYSTLDLPDPYMYDYVDSLGMPMLPVRHIYLQVPPNFDANLYFSNISFVYDYYDLKNTYYPYQEIWVDSIVDFAFNETIYYTAPDWTSDNEVSISSFNYYYDQKGFCVTIHPFSYDPIHERVRIIRKMSATIPINVQFSTQQLTFYSIKDYIEYFRSLIIHPDNDDPHRILIVTPDSLVNYLEPYITYRSSQHHSVTIITLEQIAQLNSVNVSEVTPNMIKSRLQHYYDYYWPHPKYVILVGKQHIIPFASGTLNDINNPASDYEYGLPIEYDNPQGLRMRMSVGRWPVSLWPIHVKRLIDNIIQFETMIDDSIGKSVLPVDIVSGIDYNNHDNSTIFFNEAYNTSQLLNDYDVQLYDGRIYESNSYVVQNAIRDDINNGLWMLIYNGHGNETSMGSPLNINVNVVHNYLNELPLMVFAFSCSTNAGNFGQEWVSDYMAIYHNAISYFGATTRESIILNRNYQNNIFRNFTHYHLGDNLIAGAQKMYSDISTYSDINTIKRYMLLGDPVLHIHGATYFGGRLLFSPKREKEQQTMEQINTMKKNNFADKILTQTSVYSISGHLMMQFNYDASTKTIERLLPSGMFFVVRNNRERLETEKIIKP